MTDYNELIAALRCGASLSNGMCDENCPYRTLEEMKPDFPLNADVTIDGIGYLESCDCDRMILDAADAIEQLVKERDAAVADLEFGRCCITCLSYKNKNCTPNKCLTTDNDNWEWRGF